MKDYTVLDGQITCLRNKLYDEAYQRGYEDGKKEFIGKSAKQIQIEYHDDFATALEKMYEYEERQKRYDIEKVYDPIEGAERYTFVPKKERQTETETWISMDKSRKITVPKGTFEKILSDSDDDFDI